MARWTTTSTTANLATVSFHVPIRKSSLTEAEVEDMCEWLLDDSRPGIFSITDRRRNIFRTDRLSAMTFNISDRDVAMEFKVRWA